MLEVEEAEPEQRKYAASRLKHKKPHQGNVRERGLGQPLPDLLA